MSEASPGFDPAKMYARVKNPVRVAARQGLIAVGRRLSAGALCDIRGAVSYMELGGWLARQPGSPRPLRFADRPDLFAHAITHISGSKPLYLEFGVWQGDSLRWWAEHLTDATARFVGFDSFEG